MKRNDIILGVMVAFGWGANFTVIKLGLNGIPSMLLVAVRYLLLMFPAIFFVKRPKVSFKYIVAYGLTVGVGQFSCVFYAMEIGMPAGLASIILQLQAFITPLFSTIFYKEKLSLKQLVGFAIAFIGLIIIGVASTTGGLSSIPLKAILITIGGPIFWSISNIISRNASNELMEKGEDTNTLGMVVWSSLIPPIPMFLMALIVHRPSTLLNSIANINFISVFAILYLAFVSTLFCYGVWNNLISKYPLSIVSPISLLVPISGLLVSRIVLLEQLSAMQWLGVLILLAGLAVTNIKIPKKFS